MKEIEKAMCESLKRTANASRQNKQRIIDFMIQAKIPISKEFQELLNQCEETIKIAEQCLQRYEEMNEEEKAAYTEMMKNEIQYP
jgi:hypothetical protein